MNIRIIIIFLVAVVTGAGLYKQFLVKPNTEKTVGIFSSKAPGIKDDIRFIKRSLKLYDINSNQIVDESNPNSENSEIKIFLDQVKYDSYLKKDDKSIKLAVRLTANDEEENLKSTGIFEEDKTEELLELIETTIKQPLNCLLLYDQNAPQSEQVATRYEEIAKIKRINLSLCALDRNQNISSILKEKTKNINVVIMIPGKIIFNDAELILEHFKVHKIPVFANNIGLIRCGALGGYDYDTQEISHSIAEFASEFLKDPKNIKSDIFDELHSQLHLNMDAISRLAIQLDPDLIDEAITVGGADL